MSEPVNRRSVFAAACWALFLFGALIALLGTLFGLPEMRARLGIDLVQQGQLFSAFFVGLLVSTAACGPTLDRFGHKLVLVLSAALAAVGLAGLGFAASFATGACAAVILGLGGGGLNIGTTAVVSELYPADRGRMLNLLGMFFGFGALFVPLLKASIYSLLSIDGLIGVMVSLALACAVTCTVMRFPAPSSPSGVPAAELLRVATYPGVLLFAVLLLVESGNEATVSGWLTTYIGAMGWPARTATSVLAGYWAAMIAGRALAARLSRSVDGRRLVVGCGLLTAAGCGLLMASPSLVWLASGSLLTSAALAGVFPTTLALVGDRYRRHAGTVFGFVFTVSVVGGMTAPPLVGHLSQLHGVRAGMVVPCVGGLLVAVLAAAVRQPRER